MILEEFQSMNFVHMLNFNRDSLDFFLSSWFFIFLVKLKPGRCVSSEPQRIWRIPRLHGSAENNGKKIYFNKSLGRLADVPHD